MKCNIRVIQVYYKDRCLGAIAHDPFECGDKFKILGYKGGIYFDKMYDSVESALNFLYANK